MTTQRERKAPQSIYTARFPVDLQVHTTCSDGTLRPDQVVALAKEVGVSVLAITDHDSVDGVDVAVEVGRSLGVTVIPAVEISLRHEPERDFFDMDLLGYWIDIHHPLLVDTLRQAREGRILQKKLQVERLASLGYDITWEDVAARARGVPGRPHIAEVLVERHPDEFPSIDAVFESVLSIHSPHYVPRPSAPSLEEAVRLVRAAGGLPVLAHPGLYTDARDIDDVIARAAQAGVMGLEVWYPYHKTSVCPGCSEAELQRMFDYFEALADRLGLAKTGGSDYHGERKDIQLGEQGLTWERFKALQAYVSEFHHRS